MLRLNCAEGSGDTHCHFPSQCLLPRQTPAVSRNGRTQDISNRGAYFVVGDELKLDVELDVTITRPVEIASGEELSIYIAE